MIPVFVHDGVDYSLFVISLGGGLLLFALQLLLCFKANRMIVKLIPVYLLVPVFGLAVFCLFEDSGGFIDLRFVVAALIAAIGGTYGLFVGAAWLIWYLKMKKLR